MPDGAIDRSKEGGCRLASRGQAPVFRSVKCWRAPLALALAFLTCGAAEPSPAAGPREFLIQNWTRDEGLPGATVTALAQTTDGYLWLGMFNGLVRFDGVRFTPMSLPIPQPAGMGNAVLSLHASPTGALWIGTESGHLVRLREGVFSVFHAGGELNDRQGLRQIAEDAQGDIWTANFDDEIRRWSGENFKPFGTRTRLSFCRDIAGRIWGFSGGELLLHRESGLERCWSGPQEPGFSAIAAARKGGCWVLRNGEALRFEAGSWCEKRTLADTGPAAISGFLEDQDGSLWMATYGKGLTMLTREGVLKRFTRESGLPTDVLRCLLEDREGNVWLGLEGKGLIRIHPAVFASYSRPEGLSGEVVLSACEGSDGAVWSGSNGDGIRRIKDGEVRRYGRNEGLTNEFVWAVHEDRSGRLWAGTWGGGLFRWTGAGFVREGGSIGSENVVLALAEDNAGRLLIGSRSRPPHSLYVLENGNIRVQPIPGTMPVLEVNQLATTPDGSVWVVAGNGGLMRLRDKEWRFYGAEHGLGVVAGVGVDLGGTLWVGVPNVGLVREKAGRFTAIRGLPSALVENPGQITDDGLGFLWVGSRRGVTRLKLADLNAQADGSTREIQTRTFSRADGLPSNDCSGYGFRGRDGRIWFPTASGLAVVDPRRLRLNPVPPPVVIEEVWFSGSRFDGMPGATPADADASERPRQSGKNPVSTLASWPEVLTIPAGGKQLEVHFTAMNHSAPERIHFRYQLKGLDPEPVDAGRTRVAHYGFLPPGDYEFTVTACNEGGLWNEAGASLAITVLPHYWQTWWFRLLAGGCLLGAVAGTARWVVSRRLHRRLALLEQQRALEKERLRISQDLHDDLGTSLTEINLLSTVAASPNNSAAEVREYLDSIGEKSVELVNALDEIVWAVNPKNDSLRNLVNYLCLFAQDYLRPAKIQCRLDVQEALPEIPLNAEQRHTLYLVTKEALANAVKHSGATELRLQVRFTQQGLELAIADNGRGFDPAQARESRNGLLNMADRMAALGGSGVIHSSPGNGTRVELMLPTVAPRTAHGYPNEG